MTRPGTPSPWRPDGGGSARPASPLGTGRTGRRPLPSRRRGLSGRRRGGARRERFPAGRFPEPRLRREARRSGLRPDGWRRDGWRRDGWRRDGPESGAGVMIGSAGRSAEWASGGGAAALGALAGATPGGAADPAAAGSGRSRPRAEGAGAPPAPRWAGRRAKGAAQARRELAEGVLRPGWAGPGTGASGGRREGEGPVASQVAGRVKREDGPLRGWATPPRSLAGGIAQGSAAGAHDGEPGRACTARGGR